MACILSNRKYLDAFVRHVQLFENCESLPIALQCILYEGPQIVYNTEQLSRAIILTKIVAMIQDPRCIQYWDYSQANLDILSKYCLDMSKCHWKPLKSDPALVARVKPSTKMYDLGFVGTLTPYRKARLDAVSEAGISVKVIQSFDVEAQIEAMNACWAVLNLHASPE